MKSNGLSFEPISRKLKALLKSHQNSARNYASVLAVWNSQKPAWSWSDGYSVIGQGEIGDKPEHLITLKDLEYKIIDGSVPFVPAEAARRPSIRYPNVKSVIEGGVQTEHCVNIEYLENAVKHIKGLEGKGYIKIIITDGQIHLEQGKTWAVLCKVEKQ